MFYLKMWVKELQFNSIQFIELYKDAINKVIYVHQTVVITFLHSAIFPSTFLLFLIMITWQILFKLGFLYKRDLCDECIYEIKCNFQ